MAKKYTEKVLFIGLSNVDERRVNPVFWNNDISYLNSEILKFDKELEVICKQNKVKYLNIFNLFKKEELKEGLHPNEEGHRKLCAEVLKYLEILNKSLQNEVTYFLKFYFPEV